MSDQPFVSYGQNREDVVLWRALGWIRNGRYVDVGANDPTTDSITRAFYDRGWSGITIEPDPAYATKQRAQRPRDITVQAAITDSVGTVGFHLVPNTGLSTLDDDVRDRHAAQGREVYDIEATARRLTDVLTENGFDRNDVHFLVVDVEGAEADVLRTVDLRSWRPWVLVIEATEPNSTKTAHSSWEPGVLSAGYRPCLFDGINRYYVAEEHAETLSAALSYPACALDDFVDAAIVQLRDRLHTERADHFGELLRWRIAALRNWGVGIERSGELTELREELKQSHARAAAANREITAIRKTVSWRVTRPLRTVRRLSSER